jgi:polysaccharide pyruvyl transferase WcaK-like protein
VVHSLSELTDGVEIVVLASGSLLVSSLSSQTFGISKKLSANLALGDQEFAELIELSRRRDVPLCTLSIGGDDKSDGDLPSIKHQLLRACIYASVRNPQDVPRVRQINIPCDYYPDVVWQASALIPIEKTPPSERLRIGVDLYWSNLLRQGALYLPFLLYLVVILRRDVDFVFIDTTNLSAEKFRAVQPPFELRNVSRYQFQTPFKDLQLAASLDLVLSSRIHLGIACMSYGVPFLSLFGESKTRLFLQNIGLSYCIIRHRKLIGFLWLLLRPRRLRQFLREFRIPGRDDLVAQSRGHLNKLTSILEELKSETWPHRS